jgi:3-hydroxyacyl-[acyl-carrier-protein] dehydratase
MQSDPTLSLVRQLRSAPIWPASEKGAEPAGAKSPLPIVSDLLPHKPPFLLLDQLLEVDIPGQRLRASRHVLANDPVFAGHFPGDPIYPGVLVLETIGQAAACLFAVVDGGRAAPAHSRPAVRATRIYHALFEEPVRPGDRLEIHVMTVERDDFLSTFAGQAWRQGVRCALAIGEMHHV